MKQGRGCFVRRRLVIGTRPYNYIKLFPLFVKLEPIFCTECLDCIYDIMMLVVVENNCCRNKANKGWGKEEQFPYNGSLWCVVTGPGAADCPNTSIKDLHKRGIHVSNICCPVMVLYALIYCISADGHHQEHYSDTPVGHVATSLFSPQMSKMCVSSVFWSMFLSFHFPNRQVSNIPYFPRPCQLEPKIFVGLQ